MAIKFFITLIVFSLFYGLLEIIKRKTHLRAFYTRKIAHIGSAFFVIGFYFWLSQAAFLIACSAFTLFFIFSYQKKILRSIHIDDFKSWGEIFYPIALIILGIWFYSEQFVFIASVAIMGLADAISGLYNYRNKKAGLTGSLIFLAVTIFIIFISHFWLKGNISYETMLTGVIIAITVSIIEYYSNYGTDNLTVPLATAILLSRFF